MTDMSGKCLHGIASIGDGMERWEGKKRWALYKYFNNEPVLLKDTKNFKGSKLSKGLVLSYSVVKQNYMTEIITKRAG